MEHWDSLISEWEFPAKMREGPYTEIFSLKKKKKNVVAINYKNINNKTETILQIAGWVICVIKGGLLWGPCCFLSWERRGGEKWSTCPLSDVFSHLAFF